jgi:tetratricopeptide (TPR) repeat protein
MPLTDLLQNHVDQLRTFLDDTRRSMRIVQHDADLKPVLHRLLTVLESDDACPHLLWGTVTAFHNQSQYFRDVLKELIAANESQRSELAAVGVELTPPSSEGYWAATREQFVEYISRVADNLPDVVGAYAIVIDPEAVDQGRDYKEAMHFLASHTRSKRVKYIVLDRRSKPLLDGCDRYSDCISIQVFRLSPEEIESQVEDDLDHNGSLSPIERRQYTAMLGAFAFSRRDYGEAERRQREVLHQSWEAGDAGEQTIAYYNLGNTYLSAEDPERAEACYTRAGELCLETQNNPLLAMTLTNLGIALSRQGHMAEAMESFNTACLTFQAINNYPGAAYSLDCKATVLAKAGHTRGAEEAWLSALALYDSIDSDTLREVRDCGRKDILGKLNQFFKQSGQPHKIRYL